MRSCPTVAPSWVRFQDDLAAEIKKILSGMESMQPDGSIITGAHVYTQELPRIPRKEDFMGLLPYAAIRIYDGLTDEQENEMWWVIETEIQLGIRWEDTNNQGHRIVLENLQKIADRFCHDRTLADKYIAQQDIRFTLQDSDMLTPPCHFGMLIIKFWVPKIRTEDEYC